MISGRRTYADVVLSPFVKAASGGSVKAGYYFYDLNGKVNFTLGPKDHLYLSGYFGDDKFHLQEKFTGQDGGNKGYFRSDLKWGNMTAVTRWNHEFNRKLFGNLTVHFSR